MQPHRFFERDGDDIRLNLPISLAEAVLGGKVKVPTAENPVMLTIPAGTSSGRVLRLKGKGFPRKGGERGDQLVTLMVAAAHACGLLVVAEGIESAEDLERLDGLTLDRAQGFYLARPEPPSVVGRDGRADVTRHLRPVRDDR